MIVIRCPEGFPASLGINDNYNENKNMDHNRVGNNGAIYIY
jgi:hypothetical protein